MRQAEGWSASLFQRRKRCPVAQLAGHRTVNQRVTGSSPVGGAKGRKPVRLGETTYSDRLCCRSCSPHATQALSFEQAQESSRGHGAGRCVQAVTSPRPLQGGGQGRPGSRLNERLNRCPPMPLLMLVPPSPSAGRDGCRPAARRSTCLLYTSDAADE